MERSKWEIGDARIVHPEGDKPYDVRDVSINGIEYCLKDRECSIVHVLLLMLGELEDLPK